MLGLEDVIQEERHELYHPEAHRVFRLRDDPAPDALEHRGQVAPEGGDADEVAGRPVVYVWQKCFQISQCCIIIPHLHNQKHMQVIFLIVVMWQSV